MSAKLKMLQYNKKGETAYYQSVNIKLDEKVFTWLQYNKQYTTASL